MKCSFYPLNIQNQTEKKHPHAKMCWVLVPRAVGQRGGSFCTCRSHRELPEEMERKRNFPNGKFTHCKWREQRTTGRVCAVRKESHRRRVGAEGSAAIRSEGCCVQDGEAIRTHRGILNRSDTLGLDMIVELCGLEAAEPARRETGHSAHPGKTWYGSEKKQPYAVGLEKTGKIWVR